MNQISDLKSSNNETFDEYFQQFIKPSNQELAGFIQQSQKIKISIWIRSILVICAVIFTYVVYGPDISNLITELSETSAKNTNSPLLDEICKVGMLALFSFVISYILLAFIFYPAHKLSDALQNNFLPKIVKFFGENLFYITIPSDPDLTKNIIETFGLTEQDRFDSFFYKPKDWNINEDYSIKGSYKNNKINILKINLSKGSGKTRKDVFDGILLFDEATKHKFQEQVIIKVKRVMRENQTNLFGLENQKKLFTIFCKNESDKVFVEEDFLQYLLNLSYQFKSKIECRIHQNKMLIMLRKPSNDLSFRNSSLKETPPFYKTSKDTAQKIAALLLAYDF